MRARVALENDREIITDVTRHVDKVPLHVIGFVLGKPPAEVLAKRSGNSNQRIHRRIRAELDAVDRFLIQVSGLSEFHLAPAFGVTGCANAPSNRL